MLEGLSQSARLFCVMVDGCRYYEPANYHEDQRTRCIASAADPMDILWCGGIAAQLVEPPLVRFERLRTCGKEKDYTHQYQKVNAARLIQNPCRPALRALIAGAAIRP